ncbi:DUF2188 domain-containing protein [Pelagibacterium luteolum]|uniref:DUF2188 domain-containing protein n=1 Tax=Pelagibacterium luteolum TaxID=440168 RepID=UPI000B822AC1|nr:DUF2188 domain-containing protein [Pelagibacterium luteolum]
MVRKTIHVAPHPTKGWQTKSGGASRAGSLHPTQTAAYAQARKQAIRTGAEVVIHRPNGQIRDSSSFGNDPFPPKG